MNRELRPIVGLLCLLALAVTALAIVTYAVSMIAGLGLFYYTSEGVELGARRLEGIPVFILTIGFLVPLQPSVAEVFAGLWVIYAVCFAAAWYDFGRYHRTTKRDFWRPLAFSRINYLRALPLIGAGLLFAVLVLHAVQESQGVGTGGITFRSPIEAVFNLAYSPVQEEIAFRIIPLGFAAALMVIMTGSKVAQQSFARIILLSFLSPQRAREAAGLPTIASAGWRKGVSWLEWTLAVAIAVYFGLAHYLAGGGWEFGKVTTAALSGVVLALVYFTHGAYAPILLHWFFNYYFYTIDVAAQAFPALARFPEIVSYITVAGPLGSVGFLVLIALGIKAVAGAFFGKTKIQADPAVTAAN